MKTVFLVDDSPTIILGLRAVLTKAGYGIETAGDGTEALAKLRGGLRPDVMVTDLNMPKMNGISLITETRRIGPLRTMPILMLTTESEAARRQEAKAAGANGWMVKPVPSGDLLQVLQKVLQR